jgi:hypothetical protein
VLSVSVRRGERGRGESRREGRESHLNNSVKNRKLKTAKRIREASPSLPHQSDGRGGGQGFSGKRRNEGGLGLAKGDPHVGGAEGGAVVGSIPAHS